nr:MAG TPA: hypothetical protein [Caudoviricetes sp.]
MEKIKLNNNETFEIIVNGIIEYDKRLRISFLPGVKNLIELENEFIQENTQKIYLLSKTDEVLKAFSGYTKLVGIEKQKDAVIGYNNIESEEKLVTGDLIIVSLERPDTTEKRIVALEETVDTLTLEILGM